jgi:MinD-like ATPase involved in chromosome partitioning or flagellar assembly
VATIVLTAAKGRPGVSTWASALTLVWPDATGRGVLLVDADVSGGGPLSSYQRYGLGDGRGLLAWAAGRGRTLVDELLGVGGLDRAWLLPGLPDAAGAPALGPRWSDLARALAELQAERDLDVVVDLGRLGSKHEAEPVLASADAVLLVLRSTFESISLTQPLPDQLRSLTDGRVAAVLVGDRAPYSAREVSRALGLDVVGVLPYDPKSARRLEADPAAAAVGRSSLMRAARGATTRVRELAGEVSGV